MKFLSLSVWGSLTTISKGSDVLGTRLVGIFQQTWGHWNWKKHVDGWNTIQRVHEKVNIVDISKKHHKFMFFDGRFLNVYCLITSILLVGSPWLLLTFPKKRCVLDHSAGTNPYLWWWFAPNPTPLAINIYHTYYSVYI